MLNRAGQEGHAGPVTARRLWIDQPYVSAKSMLVHAVAEANRCQSVLSESLGFCTLIGEPADLEAVELLVTSLLVQANAAMLRYGQQADRRGASRTRSFRRSFLIAYASRIGERLMASTEEATAQTGRVSELLPVLRSARERVEDACNADVPADRLPRSQRQQRDGVGRWTRSCRPRAAGRPTQHHRRGQLSDGQRQQVQPQGGHAQPQGGRSRQEGH